MQLGEFYPNFNFRGSFGLIINFSGSKLDINQFFQSKMHSSNVLRVRFFQNIDL